MEHIKTYETYQNIGNIIKQWHIKTNGTLRQRAFPQILSKIDQNKTNFLT